MAMSSDFVVMESLPLDYWPVSYSSGFRFCNKFMIFVNREKLNVITRGAICYLRLVQQNQSLNWIFGCLEQKSE